VKYNDIRPGYRIRRPSDRRTHIDLTVLTGGNRDSTAHLHKRQLARRRWGRLARWIRGIR
jgi:hypothetical protein